jgi:hypothetical protein
VAQEYRTYVRYPELAPERFKDFRGQSSVVCRHGVTAK